MGEIGASMELGNGGGLGLRDESTVCRTTVEGVVDTGAERQPLRDRGMRHHAAFERAAERPRSCWKRWTWWRTAVGDRAHHAPSCRIGRC